MVQRLTEKALLLSLAGMLAIGIAGEAGGQAVATLDSVANTFAAINAR